MTDSSPWYVKAGAGLLGVVVIMILALTKLIDGPAALAAISAIVAVFIGASAVLGGAQSIGRALAGKLPAPVTALADGLLGATAASPVVVNVHPPAATSADAKPAAGPTAPGATS